MTPLIGKPDIEAWPGDRTGDAATALVDALRAAIRERGDAARAARQQAYMKSAMPFRGLSTPDLRAALRPVLDGGAHELSGRADWEWAIRALWDGAEFREERYAALALARHRSARPFRVTGGLDLYRYLIESGAWWDLVDEVATHLVRDELLADPRRVAPELRRWSTDADMWLRRAAIISQVGAKHRTDRSLLADAIEPNLERGLLAGADGRQDFFIRKAIGWALRDHARTDPDWVQAYIETHRHRMAGLSVREALKHLPDRRPDQPGSGRTRQP